MNALVNAGAERPFRNPTRLLNGVLASVERRTLVWIAGRLPNWVSSDHLTVLALLAMLGAGASYWLARTTPVGLALAILCLALNWFGDSLDGTLARVRDRQRPRYGFYVDHVVDEFGAAFLLGGLALSGYMSAWTAVALLVGYFMLNIEVLLATNALGSFRMSFFGVGATELRILLALGTARVLFHPTVSIAGHDFLFLDVGGAVGAAGLLLTLVYSAVSNTRRLYAMEPLPPSRSR